MRTPPGAREERQEMHSPPGPLGGASPEDNDFSPERLLWTLTCRPVRRQTCTARSDGNFQQLQDSRRRPGLSVPGLASPT